MKRTQLVVLWLDDRVYLLDDIYRDSEGWITRATVVNGYWSLIFEPQNWLAYAQGTRALLEKWPVKVYQELAVPSAMRGDYNDILAWAEGVL